MTGITDRMDLGYFPLQDHAAGQDGTPVGSRQSLGGARISRMIDPSRAGSAADTIVEYAKDHEMGTLGDIHPWLFWQTRQRAARDMGAWAQLFGTIAIRAEPRYARIEAQPIRDYLWHNDSRFRTKDLEWPACFPRIAGGSMLLAVPGTDETTQSDNAYWADPRLIAPNAKGPGECGTLVVDLQPTAELCMDGANVPGIGGRHARLQTIMRVIAVAPNQTFGGLGSGSGNVLALNFGATGQEGIPNFGACFMPMQGGAAPPTGPTTPGGGTRPVTRAGGANGPGRGSPASFAANLGRSHMGEPTIGAGAFGAMGFGDGTAEEEKPPRDYGKFSPARSGSSGIACMSSMGAYGPLHGGAIHDKHNLGYDADGHPINAGHVSTLAYFYQDQEKDGPLAFEGIYPNPTPMPLQSPVHLSWDGAPQHPFRGGTRNGWWRWWAEVPYLVPSEPTPTIPPTTPPTGGGRPPTGGGPPTPGGPGPGKPTTGRPTTGHPGPPRGGAGPGPRTGGPAAGGPQQPAPPTGPGTGGPYHPPFPPPSGWPLPPPVPVTPNPGGKRFPGYPPTAPPKPTPTGPTTPGGGPGICREPATTSNPTTPGGGGPGVGGPSSASRTGGPGPVLSGPSGGAPGSAAARTGGKGRAGGLPMDITDTDTPLGSAPPPSRRQLIGAGETIPRAGAASGGPGAGGSHVKDPRLDLGRLSGLDPFTQTPAVVPGLIERVGEESPEIHGAFTIFHPMSEGFAALNFRPQLMIRGYPNFEHNPQMPAEVFRRDEQNRPQVLALRAFGGVGQGGDFRHVERAHASRARGGTAHGGVVFSPPRFELSDYYGIHTGVNVDDLTSARATTGYVLCAPGVSLALGKPNQDGTLQANATVISQETGTTAKPLVITHNATEVLRAYDNGTDVIVALGQGGNAAVRIPHGDDSQRPATPTAGMVRVSTQGPTNVLEYWDSETSVWRTVAATGGFEPMTAGSDSPPTGKNTLVLADATGGTVTVDLPKAEYSTGVVYHVKKVDNSVNVVTIDGFGSETIDGAATQSLTTEYEVVRIVCDGTEWWIT